MPSPDPLNAAPETASAAAPPAAATTAFGEAKFTPQLKPAPTPTRAKTIFFSETPRFYRARHVTGYDYGEEVSVSQHFTHLAPRPHPRQKVRSYALTVLPTPAAHTNAVDYFGNPTSYIAIQEPHRTLVISVDIEIQVAPPSPLTPSETPMWEVINRLARRDADGADNNGAGQYLFDSVLIQAAPCLSAYAAPSFPTGRPVAEGGLDLMTRIFNDFTFDPTATTVATPIAQVMTNRRGVCQDFAHVLIGCLRSLGLPARYVSGYLRTLPPPGKPRLIGADASHAWASLWCGAETGWIDLCPTNNRIADQDFITIAWGRDYDDVSPIRGVIMGGLQHGLWVQVDVEEIPAPNSRP
ncbi:putative Transglutaminase-like cysteine protease [Azospirillaceae bacterium]